MAHQEPCVVICVASASLLSTRSDGRKDKQNEFLTGHAEHAKQRVNKAITCMSLLINPLRSPTSFSAFYICMAPTSSLWPMLDGRRAEMGLRILRQRSVDKYCPGSISRQASYRPHRMSRGRRQLKFWKLWSRKTDRSEGRS